MKSQKRNIKVIKINNLYELDVSTLTFINGLGIRLEEIGCLTERAILLMRSLTFPSPEEFIEEYHSDRIFKLRQLPWLLASYATACNEIECKTALNEGPIGIRICGRPKRGFFSKTGCGYCDWPREAYGYFILAHTLQKQYQES